MARAPEPRPAAQAPESPELNPYAPPKSVAGALERGALPGLAMLAGALALERFTHDGAQTALLHEPRLPPWFDWVSAVALLIGTIAGGVAAIPLGPRATAVTGAALAAAGHVALLFGAPVWMGAGAVMIGGGAMWPCIVAAGAETLARRADDATAPVRLLPGAHLVTAVAAYLIALDMSLSLGAGAAPMFFGTLSDHFSSALIHLLDFVLTALSVALAVAGARRIRRGAESAAAVPDAPRARALAGLAILLVPSAAITLAVSAWPLSPAMMRSSDGRAVLATSLLASVVLMMAAFATLVAAALRRWSLPPLVLCGGCLALAALGMATITLAGGTSTTVSAVAVALSRFGFVAMAVATAYAAIAVRGRAATLVVSGWCAVGWLMDTVGESSDASSHRDWLLGACALICLGGGADARLMEA
jgi:MFS family permease